MVNTTDWSEGSINKTDWTPEGSVSAGGSGGGGTVTYDSATTPYDSSTVGYDG